MREKEKRDQHGVTTLVDPSTFDIYEIKKLHQIREHGARLPTLKFNVLLWYVSYRKINRISFEKFSEESAVKKIVFTMINQVEKIVKDQADASIFVVLCIRTTFTLRSAATIALFAVTPLRALFSISIPDIPLTQ